MFSEVKTYAPDEVYLTFGGYTVEGWNTIVLNKMVPTFKVVQGIRGKNTRIRNRNTHATIELTCDLTSDVNQILASVLAKDIETGGAVLNLSLVDKSGSEVFSSNEAFIRDQANRTYDDTISSRTWVIECLTSNYSSGGSGDRSIFDMIF